jgi:hypothetical protein
MNNFQPVKFNPRLEERMGLVVLLGRRRDQILLSPILDLLALEQLVADYEAAEMPCAATALKRLDWYRTRSREKEEVEKTAGGQESEPVIVAGWLTEVLPRATR